MDSFGVQVWASVASLFMILLFHELGHYILMKKHWKQSHIVIRKEAKGMMIGTIPFKKVRFMNKTYLRELNLEDVVKSSEAKEIILCGILLGLLPILINFIYVQSWMLSVGLCVIYLSGLVTDIKLYASFNKKKDKGLRL